MRLDRESAATWEAAQTLNAKTAPRRDIVIRKSAQGAAPEAHQANDSSAMIVLITWHR
jgi:hypothetical protein